MIFKEYYFERRQITGPHWAHICLSPSLGRQLASRELQLGSPRASMIKSYLLPSMHLLLTPALPIKLCFTRDSQSGHHSPFSTGSVPMTSAPLPILLVSPFSNSKFPPKKRYLTGSAEFYKLSPQITYDDQPKEVQSLTQVK